MGFRDNTVIIIETSRTAVRAALGLFEPLKTPSVDIVARVALRPSKNTSATNGSSHPVASTSTTSLPQVSFPGASVNDYLVGPALEEALVADPELPVSWPFAEGQVSDWIQAEALWKYALFTGLQLRRTQMESPALLSLPIGFSRLDFQMTCQIFFERFNIAALAVVERPVAQIYATTSASGVVIDIGEDTTDMTPIYESYPDKDARQSLKLGIRDCELYLAHLLRSNQSIAAVGLGDDSPASRAARLQLVRQLRQDGNIKVPSTGEAVQPEDEGVTDIAAIVMAGKERTILENATRKKQNAKATAAEQARAKELEALDLLTVQFKEFNLTLGKERHRLHEPLFDPSLLRSLPEYQDKEIPMSFQETLAHSISLMDVTHRQYVWQGLLVTGDVTKTIQGLGIALQSRVQPHLVSEHVGSDIQARFARVLNLPEYYAEYRKTGDSNAAFLGSSITAKLTFHETIGKAFVSKVDYSSMGPRSVIAFSPALL